MMNAHSSNGAKLEQAVALHNRGALSEAARIYQRVLRTSPGAWEASFLLGMLRLQEGDRPDAQRKLRRALELNPQHADAWYHLGEILSAEGQEQEAAMAYERASGMTPPHALASFKFGLLCEGRGRRDEAEAAYERAVAAQPAFPEALNNLANLLRNKGDLARAEELLRRAIALRADFPPAYINLGGLLSERPDPRAAREVLEAAVSACPDSAEVHFHLAVLLAAGGQAEQAVEHYQRTLALDPDHAEAYNNVGVLLLEAGLLQEAQACFERSIARSDSIPEAHNNLGNLLSQLEQHEAARAAFDRAIALRPAFAEPYNGLGILLTELGDAEAAAASFRAALERKPAFPEAAANLGAAMQRLGDIDAAQRWYDESLRLAPSLALRIKAATMLPPIAESHAALLESRRLLEERLDRLLSAGGQTTEDELLKYPDTGFYLAYHGMNDRTILEKVAGLYAQSCPTLMYRSPGVDRVRESGRPIRIGFVSRFFLNHSVGNFFNPIIERLAQLDGFEVYLFGVGYKQDDTLRRTAAVCREYVPLSLRSLPAARTAIEQRELDILVYADIGMDPFTYFLSFSRLAPRQCVLQGHSDTSGVPSLDYFISSRLIEPADAQEQYSEQLLLLDELPMILRAYPGLSRAYTRAELGLPVTGRLYICPMKLHKIHPDMDGLVAGILARDSEAQVVFFAEQRNPNWTALLRERLSRIAAPVALERVLFLPFVVDFERFRAIMAAADVALDTPHHSGGTTTNICISVGTPIVSQVGATCRGRGPAVFYALMGIEDGIVSSAQAYVDTAVSIANDPKRRATLSALILERAPRVLRNAEVLEAYADLFRRIATGDPLPVADTQRSGVGTPPGEPAAAAPQEASIPQAISLHQAGKLAEAKEIYLEVLQKDPDCADAWHLLGVIALQLRDAPAALPLIGHAIELDSSQAHYYNNLGNAFFALTRLDDAEEVYRHAVALQPDYAEAIYNLGNTLQVLQRYDEALVCYEQAVRLKPHYTDAMLSAAGLFQAHGDYAQAREWYERLLAIDPGYTDAHLHLGQRLFVEGRVQEGIAHYREYLQQYKLKYPAAKVTGIRLLALTSVKQWCAAAGDRYEIVRPAVEQPVVAPVFRDGSPQVVPPSTGTLHELYLAEIRNATVLGWHDVVLTDGERTALYDMATRNADDTIAVEHGGIRYASRDSLLMHELPTGILPVDHGVLIAGRGRDSFAHWLIDFLPRLWILDQFPEYDHWPLLVDAGLYPQQIESLQMLNRSGRPLVVLNSDTAYRIDRVVQLSDLSGMRRQTYRPFAHPSGNEVAVSADALSYLKNAFAPTAASRSGGRRLYVSRLHQPQFRRLENEREIEGLMTAHGFEVIYPEQLTFAEQVRLFSEASVLAGAGGSNMINSIFSLPGARILLLTQWHPKINYYFFSHLAQLNGHRLEYLLGQVTRRHAFYYQNDFVVDLARVEQALAVLH